MLFVVAMATDVNIDERHGVAGFPVAQAVEVVFSVSFD